MLPKPPRVDEKLLQKQVGGGSLLLAVCDRRIVMEVLPEDTSMLPPPRAVREEPEIEVATRTPRQHKFSTEERGLRLGTRTTLLKVSASYLMC